MDDSTTPPAATTPKKKRRRRWQRPLWIAMFTLIAAWAVLTHSPLTRALIVPRLENLVGAKVYGGYASIGLDGTVTLRNIALRVPSIDGEAGAVFQVKRLRAWPNWARLFGRGAPGAPLVGEVEMVEPLVRVSQSVDDGSLNISGLTFAIVRGSGPTVLPPLTVHHGALELGEHRRTPDGRTVYTVLRRLDIDSQVKRARDADTGIYTINAQQIRTTSSPRDGLIDLSGTVGPNSVSLTLRGLSLNDWPPSSIPSRLRDIFTFMDLRGRVNQLTFAYDVNTGVRAALDLQGVAVNLPFDAAEVPLEGPVQPEPPMRMKQVNGSIRFDTGGVTAELDGLLEDLPYHVAINYQGTSADSPFICDLECRNFRMEEKPQVLRFAHPIVKYRLAQFSNPTATVTTRARVSRDAPVNGVAADYKVSGTLDFEDGVAAYQTFPYEFRNLRGKVIFDDQSIKIVSLSGNSASGATVFATAEIGPLSPAASAAALVKVECRDVPVDEALEKAMGPQRGRFVSEVASTRQYQRLADAGVILPPQARAGLQDQLAAARAQLASAPEDQRADLAAKVADLEHRLGAPPLTLKGKGDVSIEISRAPGEESIWTETIDVRLGAMGLVPERFPIPIVADGVRVLIDGETIKVSGGHYRGLTGGTATVNAKMRYPSSDHPDIDPMPQIEVTASEIPADERLIAAISGAVGRAALHSSGASTAAPTDPAAPAPTIEKWIDQVLRDLRLKGAISATAQIISSEAGTAIQADATPQNLSMHPGGGERTALDLITGNIHVSEQRVAMDLTGRADARDDAGNVRVRAVVNIAAPDADFVGPPSPTAWTAVIGATQIDTTAPAEDLVRVFSPAAAQRLASLRATYKPSGKLDAVVVQSGGGPAGSSSTVEISNAAGFEFDVLGGRARADSSRGTVRVESAGEDDTVRVAFDAFTAPISLDNLPGGTLRLDGIWQPDATGAPAPGTRLDLHLTEGTFESLLTRRLIAEHTGAGLRDLVARLSPAGLYESRLILERPTPRAGAASRPPQPTDRPVPVWSIQGTLEPKFLDVTMDGVAVHLPKVSGSVDFTADSGTFNLLAQAAPAEGETGEGWTIGADGSWVLPAPGSIALQTDLTVESSSIPRGLLVFLPAELSDALRALEFKVDGRFTIPKSTIHYSEEAAPGTRSINAEGIVKIEGASFDIGALVTECNGTLQFTAERSPGNAGTVASDLAPATPAVPAAPARYDLWASLDSFRVAKIAMTDGRVRIAGGQDLGPAVVPLISADCYSGRLAGDAKLTTRPDGQKDFQTTLHLSGVRFASVMADLTGTAAPESPPPTPPEAPPPTTPPDESRGIMEASLSMGGVIGRPESRRGRGAAVIGGGSVLDMPLLLPLIKFSNLQLPMTERLNFAHGAFYVEGPVLAFEELSISSNTVKLYGYGTVAWPDLDLNLRFNSRSLRRIPILSGLIETVRDELISSVVTGTVKDPKVSTVPLPGTTALLDRLFGSDPTEDQRRMTEIRKRAERANLRVRTEGWISRKPAAPVRASEK